MAKIYRFIVREVIERTADVEAESAAEARRLLHRWADQHDIPGSDLANGGPISLSDFDSVGFKFRSIAATDPETKEGSAS